MTDRTLPAAIRISTADDPRLADYRELKEQRLQADSGKFVAESIGVLRVLCKSALAIDSVLTNETKYESAAAAIADSGRTGVALYMASQAVMDGIAGFNVHRGCLAIGRRPTVTTIPDGAQLVVALEDLVNVDNVGAIVRNACAFGADALLLSPRCADPYYRKAIRVAMGNTFLLPIVRAHDWPHALLACREQMGARLLGAVVDAGASLLSEYRRSGPVILLVGGEGPGLLQSTLALCDHRLTIPMAGADSLNVANATAVFLYQLC
ncbi:MAG: RNA methyltransferase [Deltaproteobacteria bacterium]|nr:RNA methyltransferase [Deltaproteobacteria bacterium]